MEASGPIPFRAIVQYADEYKLVSYQREALFRIIRTIDTRFLILRNEKIRKARKEQESRSHSGGNGGTVVETW